MQAGRMPDSSTATRSWPSFEMRPAILLCALRSASGRRKRPLIQVGFSAHRLTAPVHQIGHCRLAARPAHHHRNLATMIPGVAEKLRQNVLDAIAKAAGIHALILEDAPQLLVAHTT